MIEVGLVFVIIVQLVIAFATVALDPEKNTRHVVMKYVRFDDDNNGVVIVTRNPASVKQPSNAVALLAKLGGAVAVAWACSAAGLRLSPADAQNFFVYALFALSFTVLERIYPLARVKTYIVVVTGDNAMIQRV